MCIWKSLIKKKIVYLIFLGLVLNLTQNAKAQQILAINTNTGKIYSMGIGDVLSVQYKGYLGQNERFKSTIYAISDSSVFLGIPSKLLEKVTNESQFIKEIRYRDIIGFRKIGLGRQILKNTLTLGSAVGSIYLMNQLYRKNQISDIGKIGISLGVGIGINQLLNFVFPESPNIWTKDGWEIKKIVN